MRLAKKKMEKKRRQFGCDDCSSRGKSGVKNLIDLRLCPPINPGCISRENVVLLNRVSLMRSMLFVELLNAHFQVKTTFIRWKTVFLVNYCDHLVEDCVHLVRNCVHLAENSTVCLKPLFGTHFSVSARSAVCSFLVINIKK